MKAIHSALLRAFLAVLVLITFLSAAPAPITTLLSQYSTLKHECLTLEQKQENTDSLQQRIDTLESSIVTRAIASVQDMEQLLVFIDRQSSQTGIYTDIIVQIREAVLAGRIDGSLLFGKDIDWCSTLLMLSSKAGSWGPVGLHIPPARCNSAVGSPVPAVTPPSLGATLPNFPGKTLSNDSEESSVDPPQYPEPGTGDFNPDDDMDINGTNPPIQPILPSEGQAPPSFSDMDSRTHLPNDGPGCDMRKLSKTNGEKISEWFKKVSPDNPVKYDGLPNGPGMHMADFQYLMDDVSTTKAEQPKRKRFLDDRSQLWAFLPGQDGNWYPERCHFLRHSVEDGLPVITYRNGTKKYFNAKGQIEKQVDHNGNTITFIYDESDRLITKTLPCGRKVQYLWNACNGTRVSAMIDFAGKAIRTYGYDSQNRCISITYPDSSVNKYEWDAAGNMKAMINRNGYREDYEYDAKNRKTKITNSEGYSILRTYTDTGDQYAGFFTNIVETDSMGHKKSMRTDMYGLIVEFTDCNGAISKYTYSRTNQMIHCSMPDGSEFRYSYDLQGHMLSTRKPDNGMKKFQYSDDLLTSVTDENGNVTTYGYDAKGNLTSVNNAMGKTSYMAYDERGKMLKRTDFEGRNLYYQYDQNWFVSEIKDSAGNAVSFTRDIFGNILTMTDQQGRKTSFTYDYHHRLLDITREYGAKEIMQYDGMGNLVKYTDPNNHTIANTYSPSGLLKTTVNGNGTVSFDYDLAGQLLKVTDELGRSTQYQYNKKREMEKRIDAAGNAWQFNWTLSGALRGVKDPEARIAWYDHDAQGRVIKSSFGGRTAFEKEYDQAGNLTAVTNGAGETYRLDYNELNLLQSITDPLGNKRRFEYNGNGELVKEIDALGNAQSYSYNDQGLIAAITDALGSATNYQYDASGNLVNITMPEGRQKRMAYNNLNRVVKIDNGTEDANVYSYDLSGNLLKKNAATGKAENYAYNSLNQLQSMKASLKGDTVGFKNIGGELSYTFAYNNAGELTGINGTDYNAAFIYDILGRLTSKTLNISDKTDFSYDKTGRLTKVARGQSTLGYAYNTQGLVEKITRDGIEIGFAYDTANRKTAVNYPNGIAKKIEYRKDGRIVREWLEKGNEIKYEARYEYNQNGYMTNKSEQIPVGADPRIGPQSREYTTEITTYEYDAIGRLTKAVYPDGETEEFSYDAEGNRLALNMASAGEIRYEYDQTGQLLKMTVGGTSRVGADPRIGPQSRETQEVIFAFNKDGSMTARNGAENASYTYGPFGRLITIEKDGNMVEYTYAPTGERLTRRYNDSTGIHEEKFAYVGANILEITTDKGMQKVIPGKIMDEIFGFIDEQGTFHGYFQDFLGSVKLQFSAAGSAEKKRNYRSFGYEANDSESGFGFTGREYDAVADHYFYRSRFYDPKIGRFLSRDSFNEIGMLSGGMQATYNLAQLNDFSYVGNSPLMFSDPTGCMWAPWGNIDLGEDEARLVAKYCAEEYLAADDPFRKAVYFLSGFGLSLWSDDSASLLTAGTITFGTSALMYAGASTALIQLQTLAASLSTALLTSVDRVRSCDAYQRVSTFVDNLVSRLSFGRNARNLSDIASHARGVVDLKTKLAMEQVMSNPSAGTILKKLVLSDPKWPASQGWVKVSQKVNKVEIHYVLNELTKVYADFKVKMVHP
ncbi:MAG: hypothetical protein PHQ23_04490 [Candidatus Wallbacteria bacterium]|nr:hypothetical protein [Candidatus Wallbacteria bacterium]